MIQKNRFKITDYLQHFEFLTVNEVYDGDAFKIPLIITGHWHKTS